MGLARPGTGTAAAGHCRLPSAAVTLSKLGAPCGAEMVRHVISWCAMTCAYGNTGVRTFSVYAVLSTAARLWAAAVPSGNAGATPRSREGCGRRSNIRSDWRECRARRGNQRGGRCDRRCYPPRHGTQFRLLLLTSACKVGDRPREEARDEPQAHARAVGALARCLRAAATAADANLGSSATGSRASDAKSASSLFRGSNRSRAWGVDHVRCSDLLGAAEMIAPPPRCSITGTWPRRRVYMSSMSA